MIINYRSSAPTLLILCLIWVFASPPVSAAPAENGAKIEILWHVPKEHVKEVRDDLQFKGKIVGDPNHTPDNRALPLVYLIGGAVALDLVVDTILKVIRHFDQCGIILDTRGGKVDITHDQKIKCGTVVVIDDKGSTLLEEESGSLDKIALVKAMLKK